MPPKSVEKVIDVPFETLLPYTSRTGPLMVLVLEPSAGIKVGFGVRVATAGGPGVKVTVVLPKVVPPYFVVIWAVPDAVPAVMVDVTLPP